MTKVTHNYFLCIYFNSLHVSSNLVLIIRRINCINTTSGICHSDVGDRFVCRLESSFSTCTRNGHRHQRNIYQMLYWYNWFSWWWARVSSKHVENLNKYIEKNFASSWSFIRIISRCTVNKIIKLLRIIHIKKLFEDAEFGNRWVKILRLVDTVHSKR
jgi:hypothetical protein